MRYRLRTLLILLAILPPLLAISWVKWQEYREYLAEQRRAAVQPAGPVTWFTIVNGTPTPAAQQPRELSEDEWAEWAKNRQAKPR